MKTAGWKFIYINGNKIVRNTQAPPTRFSQSAAYVPPSIHENEDYICWYFLAKCSLVNTEQECPAGNGFDGKLVYIMPNGTFLRSKTVPEVFMSGPYLTMDYADKARDNLEYLGRLP